MFRDALVCSLTLALTACPPPPPVDGGTNGGETCDPGVVCEARVQAIYDRSCAVGSACHNAAGARALLSLAPEDSYAQTVNVPSSEVPGLHRIVPNDPERSFLYLKLTDAFMELPECRQDPSACGARMPMVGGAPLACEDRALIRAWIAQGAPRE